MFLHLVLVTENVYEALISDPEFNEKIGTGTKIRIQLENYIGKSAQSKIFEAIRCDDARCQEQAGLNLIVIILSAAGGVISLAVIIIAVRQ
jgi:hypothetical protein